MAATLSAFSALLGCGKRAGRLKPAIAKASMPRRPMGRVVGVMVFFSMALGLVSAARSGGSFHNFAYDIGCQGTACFAEAAEVFCTGRKSGREMKRSAPWRAAWQEGPRPRVRPWLAYGARVLCRLQDAGEVGQGDFPSGHGVDDEKLEALPRFGRAGQNQKRGAVGPAPAQFGVLLKRVKPFGKSGAL